MRYMRKRGSVIYEEEGSVICENESPLTFCVSQKEIDELVEDWTPEPLVAAQTPFEEAENEKRPVIVGFVKRLSLLACTMRW